jgi:hypothetical protein
MSDTAAHPAPEPRPTRDPGHETSDASGFYVSIFALALAAAIALLLLLTVWVFDQFASRAERRDPMESPLAVDQIPPAPRLEANPGAALSEFRAREDDTLTTYGWVDRRRGVVRLPIDRAIELLAERGLPEPEGPAVTEETPSAPGGKPRPEEKPGAP